MSELASENVRRTFPIKYLVGILIFFLATGIGFCIYYFVYWQDSPRYALWQMVRAIQHNDTKTLFNYVDLQAVADNLVEQSAGDLESLLQKKGLGPDQQEDDVSRLVRSLTKKFAKFIAPKVVVSLEPQIKSGLENYLSQLNAMEKAALSAIPPQARIQQDDNMAAVSIVDPINNKTYHFRMARSGETNTWRIVEINYQDFRTLIAKQLFDK